jgi:hypothetical protein
VIYLGHLQDLFTSSLQWSVPFARRPARQAISNTSLANTTSVHNVWSSLYSGLALIRLTTCVGSVNLKWITPGSAPLALWYTPTSARGIAITVWMMTEFSTSEAVEMRWWSRTMTIPDHPVSRRGYHLTVLHHEDLHALCIGTTGLEQREFPQCGCLASGSHQRSWNTAATPVTEDVTPPPV